MCNLHVAYDRHIKVLLREFSLRAGSGGEGAHRGGDGVIRELEFRKEVQAILAVWCGGGRVCACVHACICVNGWANGWMNGCSRC